MLKKPVPLVWTLGFSHVLFARDADGGFTAGQLFHHEFQGIERINHHPFFAHFQFHDEKAIAHPRSLISTMAWPVSERGIFIMVGPGGVI